MNEENKFQFTSINCWTDGSGFEFDGEPFNLIGFTPNSEQFFSLTGKLAKNTRKGWQLWSNWIDKFQTDYRFLLLSDENAETILQPNVDDPWMFTEYIFKGIGKQYNDETNSLEEIDCLVVEPPLYDEKSLVLKNPDRIFPQNIEEEDYDKFTKFDIKNECASYNRNRIIAKKDVYVKACRTINENGWGEGYEVNDPGAKLYKVSINVESVKWGEHGNIPPHTLNMCSPSSWLDTKVKKTIQPVTIAKVGYPVYATVDGVFYHAEDNNDYIVNPIPWLDEKGEGNLTKFYYEKPEEGGILQPKGKSAGNASKNEMSLKYIKQSENGDLIHEGCEFFVGKGGCASCSAADSNDMEFTETLKLDKDKCSTENRSCPKFIKKPKTAISTYETVAQSKDQYFSATYGMYASDEERRNANLLTAIDAGGGLLGGMGAALAFGMLQTGTSVFQPGLKDYTQNNVYFETSFKFVETPVENFKIEPENPTGNGKGVKVVRGSGNQNIDNIIPWKGGDSYAVGDANQINFPRLTQSVMPCYNPDYCNELCGLAMQSGYDVNSRAGSSTQNSPETNSEYIDYCRYYKSKKNGVECPFDSIPKTAYEFQQVQIIGKNSLEEVINRWIGNYNHTIEFNNIVEEENTMFVKKINAKRETDDIPEHYILYGKKDESANFGGLNCSQKESVKIKMPQINNKNEKTYVEKTIEAYKICKFTLTSINPSVARIDELYFWWTPLDNNGKKIYRNGNEVIWFCKFEENIAISSHFTHYVDNWNKFIGGFHPQYKDYSKRGGEFIQEKESQTERDAMGDLGGDPEYSGIEQPKSKQGYWIDEDGEWIMDELELGESLKYDENGNLLNKKTYTLSKLNSKDELIEENFSLTDKEYEEFSQKDKRENTLGVSLSYRKSNTIIGEDGQTQGPQTINCTININDTKGLVEALYFSPPQRYEEDKKPISMPPSVSFLDGLPAERSGAYCSVCDYYLNEKCGTNDKDEGLYCPWCGTKLELKPLKKLFKQKAIGQVDYWGLPGTVIDSKSYFWKTPTLINNAMLDQIKFKAKSNASFTDSQSEVTNGYITDFKGYYKPIPSKEEVNEMPEAERKKLWELVKDNDREDISAYNDLINKVNTSVNGFDVSETDDRLIVPYSDTDGLKFFTLNHLKKLRKSVEPAMGYVIGTYRGNPDYNRLRPTYEDRNSATAPRYWIKGKCGVQPQILAANTMGSDCYIQYWSGDPERGSVRDYYPPGSTWWMLNNVIGIRYSDNKGSYVHMDDGTYGDRTHSMMCCFLHGFLPLNKKILAAYAIIYPTTNPSREPLGRDWNGRVHYNHYHAFTKVGEANSVGTPHESLGNHLHKRAGHKECVFDNVGDMIPWSAVGQGNENLYIKTDDGWIPGAFTSEKENRFERMKFDDNGVPHYVPKRPQNKRNFFFSKSKSIGEFKDDGRYPEWLTIKDKLIVKNEYQSYYDFGENEMADATSDLNHFFDNGWWGKLEGGLPVWDYIKLEGQYEGEFDEDGGFIPADENWTKWGKDIIQLKTNNEMWKQLTSDEFDEYVEYNTGSFNFSCSDGEVENSYDFTSVNQDLIDSFFTEQMQEIPGYFNYNGMNSAGYQNINIQTKVPEIDEKWKNEQILYQIEGSSNSRLKSDAYKEGGNIPQILDITNVVKNCYSKRMDCEFNCEAGKEASDVLTYMKNPDESRWEGIGADFDPKERILWNKRYSIGCGILLSDCYHYPKLNSESKVVEATDGEKLDLSVLCKSDVFQCDYIFPKPIDENNDTIIIKSIYQGEEKSQTIKLNHIDSISFEGFCKEIEAKLNDEEIKCSISVLSNQRWTIGVEDCFSFSIKGNAISYIGGKDETYYSTANRVISYTSCLEGFNPINLIKGNMESCEPIRGEDQKGWRTEIFQDESQNFIIDLCQTPFENSRRDWRYRSGSINCSNCYCPNENCITNLYYHPNKVTVGNWAAKKNLAMSAGQSSCPACGTDLSNEEGAVAIESDGIRSYYYDTLFDYNPLIKEIHILPCEDELFRCGFNVYCQNAESGIWICVLKASYDQTKKEFDYWCIDFAVFKNNETLIFNENFRARYVKIETFNVTYRVSYEGNVENSNENLIFINEYTDIDTEALVGQVIRFDENAENDWEIDEETSEDLRIISNYIQDGKLIIKLDDYVPEGVKNFKFYANKYYSGIGKLEVYGIPFRENELTILPPAEFETGEISTDGLKLSQQPIQIMSVYAGSINGGMIKLEELSISGNETHENILKEIEGMCFETVEKTYLLNGKEIKYYDIKSGKWCHEPRSNRIFVPTKANINGEYLPLNHLTKNLEDNGVFLKNIDVNQMVVEYWNASNSGITLQASAVGMGPAYQLETESICKIKNPEKLPDCGMSVELFTSESTESTQKKKIEWFCYNHIPSTMKEQNQTLLGGYFKKPTFYGTELGALSSNTASSFKKLFGENCSRISPRCFTEVTFYGKPNSIISGNIIAYAPKENKISYEFPGSGNLTITEKTGGLADGMFVLEIKKGSGQERGRKTKAWNNPLIVVYAEDEEPFSGQ